MQISIEIPVFKGAFLRPCLDSVLAQTSDAWTLSLVWDGGDRISREILEQLVQDNHPRIRIYFTENQGIARARKFLTERGFGDYILPVDDDDRLTPHAVERFLAKAEACPWASLIRARRQFIDATDTLKERDPWFSFGPRHYSRGMVTDIFNQTQPYLIRRSAYERTQGWRGYADFKGAGEDCDMFLQLEEVAHFEFIDEVLYHYRLHSTRASEDLTPAAGFEMWRRLADETLKRVGLPLVRANLSPPFKYDELSCPTATVADVDFVLTGTGGGVAATLRAYGVTEDAIHSTVGVAAPGAWQMAGFRSTKRRLVCVLDENIEVQTRSTLEKIVQVLEETPADLLALRLPEETSANYATPPGWHAGTGLLIRREVLAATGGFDDRFVPASVRGLDFWLQARRRDFRCAKTTLTGAAYRARPVAVATATDESALRAKWTSYPELLAEIDRDHGGALSSGHCSAQ